MAMDTVCDSPRSRRRNRPNFLDIPVIRRKS